MRPRFLTRRAIQLALTANALRPLPGERAAIPAFFAGWLTGELAPHLLALTAADTAAHLARHGTRTRPDRVGLALSLASMAGLGALIADSQRARGEIEHALAEALGEQYLKDLRRPPDPKDLATPWGQLVLPFRMHNPEVRRDRNVAYAPGGRRFLLDIYRPRELVQGRPVLLQIHGGAWMVDSKDHQGIPLMQHMAQRGWVCVAVNYPLSPKARWPDHIVAVKRAVAWVREHIDGYGGDPAFLAATGGSAGGHLAALLALTPNDPSLQPGFEDADTTIQACAPHYGVYDFAATSGASASEYRLKTLLARYVVGKDPVQFLDDYIAASPLDRINDKAPPFFVIHGERDTMVPVAEAREFVRRLREASPNPVAYAEISGAQHAFDVFPSIRSAHVVRGVERFLEWAYLRSLAG
ncbi:acetyl esterase/lipase [Amycolatopsis bartoniae]|uniref:Alpha/beta hydrolase n=1 Tax=Amycolatopsis bartoniae TaxID=941986 RepID=A0A8H9MDX8_9PSEU|nr:alpha/beta hydrolase [Amycolatopsis bartoniae]MBB2937648.1 acetyl esterase/lipase [Amycolatopsis bartoniae]TVS98950.1 alpha/beta hydrolase [Amycolatopsis bartoniae]GHF82806.1 alpha/beta hydrolase [Amycolatopsis bartoniae]